MSRKMSIPTSRPLIDYLKTEGRESNTKLVALLEEREHMDDIRRNAIAGLIP